MRFAEIEQVLDDLPAGGCRQDFVAGFADLGRKQADPDLFNFLTLRPERHEFGEITGPLGHLTCNSAMDCDFTALDAFQNPSVRCGFAAFVMFGGQTVD